MQERDNVTPDVSNTKRDLHATIQYSRLQIEAAKLRVKGYSDPKIADMLGVHYQSVHRALKSFEKVGPQIVKDVSELSDVGYWQKIYTNRLKITRGGPQMQKAMRLQEQLIKDGYWPGTVPFGYVRKKGKIELELDPEKAKLVERIFAARIEGKTQVQLVKETGVSSAGHIYTNPFYYGVIRWKGMFFPGKHPAIVSKETFESAQILKEYPISRCCRAPYGYRWVVGRLRKDPEKAEKVRQIFLLRAQGKTQVEIARRVGLNHNRVRLILSHPIYKGVSRNGAPMPPDFEPIVDANTWWVANRVHTRTFREIIEEMRARGRENRQIIKSLLARSPATNLELIKQSGLNRGQVTHATRSLKREGVIKKKGGIHGKWYLLETAKPK